MAVNPCASLDPKVVAGLFVTGFQVESEATEFLLNQSGSVGRG